MLPNLQALDIGAPPGTTDYYMCICMPKERSEHEYDTYYVDYSNIEPELKTILFYCESVRINPGFNLKLPIELLEIKDGPELAALKDYMILITKQKESIKSSFY